MTVHELFESQVNLYPTNLAVVYNNQSLTYEQFNKKANQLAHYLQALGVKPERPVALCMARSIDLLIAMFAILKAGGGYIPFEPFHPEQRITSILNENQVPFLVLSSDLKDKFLNYEGEVIFVDKAPTSTYPATNPISTSGANNLAYIIYTSGSTGKPKGVLIEHSNVINFSQVFNDFCACYPGQRIDFSSSHAFDMAIANTLLPLMLGMTIIICDDDTKKSPHSYLEFLRNNQINVIKLTPSYFKVLLYAVQGNFIELSNLRLIILGGELLHTIDCSSWLARYPHHHLVNEYGPTETTVGVSLFKFNKAGLHALRPDVPIGKPGKNVTFYLLDNDLKPVPTGEIGELYIGGSSLARGYFNQPEITNKKFIINPFSKNPDSRLYKTGDLCRQLADGNYEYLGRIDHQIKIRGFRVELGEIERCLASHPAIQEAIVIARTDHLNEKQLVAYYILKDKTINLGVNQIKQYLKQYLTDYMIPAALIAVDFFPLNANGKLDRDALPVPELSLNRHYLAPTNELEQALTEIWSEELGLNPIGTHDNFFELGGHSLAGARIITKINQMLGKNITVKELYQAPTIAELAVLMRHIKTTNKRRAKNSLATSALMPLSNFQLLLWLSNTFEPKAKKLNIISQKRLQGAFNKEAFTHALAMLLKNQEVLSYKIFRFKPGQCAQSNLTIIPEEVDLTTLNEQACKAILAKSIYELINYYPWPQKTPLLRIKIFYLKNNVVELQACMPHMIADGTSINILWAELSNYYLAFNKLKSVHDLTYEKLYRRYLENELLLDTYSNKDHDFWLNYLKDACFFNFPAQHVIKNMAAAKVTYSTYLEIPKKATTSLLQFCAHHHFGLNEALCAVLGAALVKTCPSANLTKEPIFMNVVKSARDNPLYDKIIGCFLKLEPIKLVLNPQSTVMQLAQQLQQTILEAAPYQQCPGLLKLACLNSKIVPRNRLIYFLVKIAMPVYARLFPSLNLNPKLLSQLANLASISKRNKFMVNVNVWDSFVALHQENKGALLFNLKSKASETPQFDLLNIDYLLDICFIRSANNKPYLVISANLEPKFRELLGQEIIKIMQNVDLVQNALQRDKC